MTIDGIGSGSIGPHKTHESQEAQKAADPTSPEAQLAAADRGDVVEISSQGRNLLEGADIFATDPTRVARIRENIDQGLYNTPAVAEQIAVRLLSEV